MVTFGRKEIFLDFYLVYNRFSFKILQTIQQKLEKVTFGQFSLNFVYF